MINGFGGYAIGVVFGRQVYLATFVPLLFVGQAVASSITDRARQRRDRELYEALFLAEARDE